MKYKNNWFHMGQDLRKQTSRAIKKVPNHITQETGEQHTG
jgi:hypothetical protein